MFIKAKACRRVTKSCLIIVDLKITFVVRCHMESATGMFGYEKDHNCHSDTLKCTL